MCRCWINSACLTNCIRPSDHGYWRIMIDFPSVKGWQLGYSCVVFTGVWSSGPLHHLGYSLCGILRTPEILFHAKSKLPTGYAGNTLQMRCCMYVCIYNPGLIDLFLDRKNSQEAFTSVTFVFHSWNLQLFACYFWFKKWITLIPLEI